jgi:EmrB/QacA subfamily drug resistance transporter
MPATANVSASAEADRVTTAELPRAERPRAERRRENLLLVIICLAQFMVILDISIVNVALPSIRSALHFSTSGLQWVVNAYTLTFAGLLLLGGRASDLLGRREVFLVGTGLFSLASLACALSDSQALLDGARAVQGIGGAIISPASLAILTTSFAEGRERNRALGIWGAIGGIGGASGALLGGILTQSLGWQWVFLVNVPVGALVILLGYRVVPHSRADLGHRHFDLAGALLVTLGFTAVVYGIVRTDTLSWGNRGVLIPIAAGVLLLLAFVAVEGRFAEAPLVPLRIFRRQRLRSANLVVLALYMALFVMWFFLTLYLQGVLHWGAIKTGLGFVPMTLGVSLAAARVPWLAARIGTRWTLTIGMLSATVGLVLLSGIRPGGSYVAEVLPGGLLATVGLGLALVPATIVAVEGVPAGEAGLASGLLNTSRLLGGALGLAVLTTIATSRTHAAQRAGVGLARALTDGYDRAFLVGGGMCLIGAIAAVVLLREHGGRRVAAEPLPGQGALE